MPAPMWTPSPERVASANMTAFRRHCERRCGVELPDYAALYRWSVEHPERFWPEVWSFCGVQSSHPWDEVVIGLDRMPGAKWFPGARLNFAENLLRRRDDRPALVFWRNKDVPLRSISYAELYRQVAAVAAWLRSVGVGVGDRVAGFLPNIPETVVAMLAASSLGAVWSSTSPDFGEQGVLDRFGQIEPKVLFTADGYRYGGREFDSLARAAAVVRRLPTLERVVIVPHLRGTGEKLPPHDIAGAVAFDELLTEFGGGEADFVQLPFDHPLYVLYSSGTTGAPKGIVHGAGGTLIQHLKELVLHTDLRPADRIVYATTCGWMMWNWMVSSLAVGATVVLYDGSPFAPTQDVLFDLVDAERVTVFGTSARYLAAIEKAGLEPARTHDLSSLRTLLSTGSPLAPESYDYVYRKVKSDVQLSSISGGTDIVSCFALGNPVGAVYRGEIQTRGLGMAVEVYGDDGRPVERGKGELVCVRPFPSMPVGFWNDPDGTKYHDAYFDVFPNVWRHGDYVELTGHDGVIVHGRSDAVLNPNGVRIGTAEIYRQVEQFPEVLESLVVGQAWDGDQRIVLFVKLRDGLTLDAALVEAIRQRIRRNMSPRHTPAKVVQVADIPRTRSGKISELAVRDVIHGRPVQNREALANPESLELFRDLRELSS